MDFNVNKLAQCKMVIGRLFKGQAGAFGYQRGTCSACGRPITQHLYSTARPVDQAVACTVPIVRNL